MTVKSAVHDSLVSVVAWALCGTFQDGDTGQVSQGVIFRIWAELGAQIATLSLKNRSKTVKMRKSEQG